MEPLAEENEKLKQAMNLSDRNIQRARRERDLVESNTQDLEYQKGVLAEKIGDCVRVGTEPVRSTGRCL